MKKKLIHLLITLDLTPEMRMHSYVICLERDERRIIENVTNRMVSEVEKEGFRLWPGIGLVTRLDTGIDVVQAVLDEHYPAARSHFDKVKDFHLTMWAMPTSAPSDAKLMELH